MSRTPTPSRVDLAADIADSTRYPPGWRTPYVRGRGTAPPPADLSDASDWFAERVVATEGGSYIAGVPPMDGSDDEFRTAAFVAIPSVAAAVSRAMGDGAKITVLTEGTAFDPDGGGKPRDESELVAATVSGAARKTGAAVPSFDTWDDDPVNVYDPKSTVWDRLAEATGDRDVARAAIAARMLSVGATVEDLRDVGILDDGSAPRFEELTGRKVPKKVTDGIRSDLRRMVHPHEHDGDPTVVSAVSALYDSMRASNLLRKVHEVERDGGVAIAVVPPWMGYALKPVIARQNKRERNRRKQASVDLEMAWGWNARVAAKISEIMSGINPKVVSGARSVTPKLKRADPNNAMWTYTVPGSKGETYTVKVKGLPRGNLRAVSKMDVEVSCSCPFFRYQGPEHWAKVGDYLYGKPAGTATRPDQKDPDGRNRVCKHVAAVFERAGNMFYTPPKGKKAASEGRVFKSVGSVRTGAGNAQVVFDPEVTTEGTARRALQFIKSIPTRDLSMSAARRFEIFDNPEDVSQRLDEVGIVADDLSNGAFDFRTGIVYACVWDGYASSLRTLMHEIGHSIVGRDEAMAESWYANRQHMDAKWAGFDRAGNMSHTPPKGKKAASTPVPDRFAPNEAGVMTRDEYIRHLNPDDRFHPSTAYNYSTFDLNERYARRHLGTVRRTYKPTLKVEGSTSGTLFIDEDDRPVAVLHGGTLYHDDRGEGIPDEYRPGGGEPVPLDIRDRRRVKYIAEYVARVDDLARRTATRYPVVLRRLVHGGEPMTLRAEKQPVPDKGVNLVVADSAGRILGVAQNEWGATLIAVARDARGRGIGAILSKVWHELNPSFGSGGMTGAGNALMQSVWADRVREFLSFGWYTQMVRDGRMTSERVREILADLPGRRPRPAAPRPAAPRPMVMSDGETFVTVYDRAVLDDPGSFASDPDDDMVYGHAFLRDAPGVGTFVYSIEYDRRFAELTTRAILQLARDNGDRLYVGDRGYHDPLEGVESIPGVTVDGDYLTVGSDVLPLRSMAELERRTRRPVDPHGEVEVALMGRADAKWR